MYPHPNMNKDSGNITGLKFENPSHAEACTRSPILAAETRTNWRGRLPSIKMTGVLIGKFGKNP